jgi:hypothetical protein
MSTVQSTAGGPARWPRFLLPVLGALVVWFALYNALQPAATYLSCELLRLEPKTHLGSAVEFFVFGVVSLPCTGPVLLLLVAGTSVGAAAALARPGRLQTATRWVRRGAAVLILAGGAWLFTH